jgi:hypothetical protein
MKRFLGAFLATMPLLFAQTPPAKPAPRKVDAALRSRVTEFHQYMIDGTFRRALDMVAQDSQDFFLSTSKNKQTVFKIEEIAYSDKFTKAVVKISTTYRTLVGFRALDLPTTLPDYWKLVGGKWMWYHDAAADRPNFFGVPLGDASKPESVLAQALPKDTSNQALGAAAQSVLQGTPGPVLDKNSMEFVLGTPGEQQVVVRNPYRGQVRVAASLFGPSLGVSTDPDLSVIDSLGTASVTIHYDPQLTVPGSTVVRFEIQPFHRVFSLSVNIVRPAATATPAFPRRPAKP